MGGWSNQNETLKSIPNSVTEEFSQAIIDLWNNCV